MSDIERTIAAMAHEVIRALPDCAPAEAWGMATGLLAGYRLGDPIAAAGMLALGEDDCRRLVREAMALERDDLAPADILASLEAFG